MFPTTIWTQIREAGSMDPAALDQFARQYRPAVLSYIAHRGFQPAIAEDLCQEVFIRLLRNDLLSRADPQRGKFRTLMRTLAMRVATDHLRKTKEQTSESLEQTGAPHRDDDALFDQQWALHLVERAMQRLREEKSPYFDVLAEHLSGQHPDRNRLWHARKRLASYVRHEIAMTCASQEEFDEELRDLSPYLHKEGKASQENG